MLECPSQRDTFRRSLVACSMVRAQVCLRTCGETRFDESVEQRVSAVWTCLHRMYSKPARVMASLRSLGNSSGTRTSPRTDSHARTADAVSFRIAFAVNQNAGLRLQHHIFVRSFGAHEK